jgi:hypothetical protein
MVMYLTSSFSKVRYASAFSMSPAEAMRELGIKGTGDFEKDKTLIRKLVKKYHPDVSPEPDAKKKMEALTALINLYTGEGKPLPTASEQAREAPSSFGGGRARDEDLPPWQTDYRSHYNGVGGPGDINYNKKRIYEVSLAAEGGDRSKLRRMTVWGGGTFEVFGSDKVYPEIARCMRVWSSRSTEFVLVSEDRDVRIIWIKGHDVNIPIEHESFNLNPFNDRDFVRDLSKIVAEY